MSDHAKYSSPKYKEDPTECACSSKGGGETRASTIFLTTLLVAALAIAGFVDTIVDVRSPAIVYVAYGLAWIAASIPMVVRWPSRPKLFSLAVFVVLLAVLYLVPTKRDRFLDDLDRIRPGMTVGEVQSVMEGYFEIDDGGSVQFIGAPAPPKSELTLVFQHTRVGPRSADHGRVTFNNDHVTTVNFLPD